MNWKEEDKFKGQHYVWRIDLTGVLFAAANAVRHHRQRRSGLGALLGPFGIEIAGCKDVSAIHFRSAFV